MKYAYVIVLGIVSYLCATDIYSPSMPDIALYFHKTSDEVQQTMSYYLFGSVIMCIISGLFADQYGKKKTLLLGMGIALAGSILTMFSSSLDWLIFGRFIQGFGGGAAMVLGFSAIQELYDEDQQGQVYALMGVLVAAIPAVAPFLGGVISTYFGWQIIFAIIGLMFAFTYFCIWYYLPDSLNKKTSLSSKHILKSYKSILTSRLFLVFALLAPLYCSIEWFYLTYLPFYVQNRIGLSPELYGFYLGLTFICFSVGSYLAGKLLVILGGHKTILIALSIGLFSGLLLWLVTVFAPLSVFWVFFGVAVFSIGFAIIFPSTVSVALNIFKDHKTRASSIRTLIVTAFSFMGSFIAEKVDDTQLSSFAAYVSVACVLAFLIYCLKPKRRET